MSEDNRYPLDDALISMVQDLRRMEMQLQGALLLFARQNKLEGNWDVDPNGRELVKRP